MKRPKRLAKRLILELRDRFSPYRVFGRRRETQHVWPPTNFSTRPRIVYKMFDEPLAYRGVFLDRHYGNDCPDDRFRTFFGEHLVLKRIIASMDLSYHDLVYVDIGAGDGIDMSNTYLIARGGGRGYCIEFNSFKFAMMAVTYQTLDNVCLAKAPATPQGIAPLLRGLGVPPIFDFLNLDIDSYDYDVLSSVLEAFRIRILCVEINPEFPLSIDFAVRYPAAEWDGTDFQGMSFSMAYKLLRKHQYRVIRAEGASVFAIEAAADTRSFPEISLDQVREKYGSSKDRAHWEEKFKARTSFTLTNSNL